MTGHRRALGRRHIQGFSLIELMVSLTIGLIIAIAAMSAYLGASGASRLTDAQSRMNEDAQAALTILSQQLQMAGTNPNQANRVVDTTTTTLSSLRNPIYTPTPTFVPTPTFAPGTFTLSAFSINGCDGKFTNISGAANLDSLTCAGGTTTLADSIAVSYEADQFNSEATTGGSATDCLGNGLPTITASNVPVFNTATATVTTANPITYQVADNRFYVGTSSAITSPSLYCKGNGGATPQPLVENIEDLQFQYGTMNATSTTATVAGYLPANEVITQTDLAALASDAERWSKVLSVRICVLVRSDAPVVNDANSARYRDCGGNMQNAPDLRLRRAYFATVALRNRRP